jgi:V/A-type H+-transporting ATPase subunit K
MEIVLLLVLLALIGGIVGFGIWARKNGEKFTTKAATGIVKSVAAVGFVMLLTIGFSLVGLSVNKMYSAETNAAKVMAADTAANAEAKVSAPVSGKDQGAVGLGYLAVALAVGLGSLGAGVATGMSAAAAIGAISEDPKAFGNAIIFVGMSEGIAIYGLAIAIMIYSRL